MRALALLGLLVVLMGADTGKTKSDVVRKYRLVLAAEERGGIFFSAWNDGDVIAAKDASDGAKVEYRRRYRWGDGCAWVAVEKLVPVDKQTYKYSYRETPVACPKGVRPDTGATTPRDGTVTVHLLDTDKPLTPLDSWVPGWGAGD